MIFLRSLVFFLVGGTLTAVTATTLPLLLWAPVSWRTGLIRVWRRAFMAAIDVLLGIRYRVDGLHNLPTEPVVILSKHQSAWETVALQDVFAPRWLSFVYKKELNWVPFVGWALRSLPMVEVDRGAGKVALASVVKHGKARLNEGRHVLIFPEGTRVAPGQSRRFKIGGAHLAVEAGVKVVPVAHNAGEFWPRNAFLKRPGEVVISIGPAIDSTGLTADQLNTRVEAWIEAEARRISPQCYATNAPDAVATG